MHKNSILVMLAFLCPVGLLGCAGEEQPCTALAEVKASTAEAWARAHTVQMEAYSARAEEYSGLREAVKRASRAEALSALTEESTSEAEVCTILAEEYTERAKEVTEVAESWGAMVYELMTEVRAGTKEAEKHAWRARRYDEEICEGKSSCESFFASRERELAGLYTRKAEAAESAAITVRVWLRTSTEQMKAYSALAEAYTALSKASVTLADLSIPLVAEAYTALAEAYTEQVELSTAEPEERTRLVEELTGLADAYTALAEKSVALAEK
ncbi:MAG: hypothetical protein OXL40_10125 [Bacteroidota bacterium]|nr:hypothetical protein [Bacteroidota bacterium]